MGEAEKQTGIWTCRDGTEIRICDMSDNHLRNTVNLLTPKIDTHLCKLLSRSYDGDIWINLEDICPVYDEMVIEMNRRGLKRR